MKVVFLRLALAFAALICLAPSPGDIGGCGQVAEDLDAVVFFSSKQRIECLRCDECRLSTPACQLACEGSQLPGDFPPGCYPLVHDGTVCLRALTQASCEAFQKIAGEPPSVPSECNFCPI